MPGSKTPKKPPAKRAAPKRKAAPPALPDMGDLEELLASLAGSSLADDAVEAAQEIMYDAWEAPTRSKRVALAKKALETSPLCADAYLLLAREEAKSPNETLALHQRAVAAGEQALGPHGFEEFAGHFWGFLETRPYMRARAALADSLWQHGRQSDALDHYAAMLELNPGDNQGVRYILAARLLALDDIKRLKRLLKTYKEDGSAQWLYTRALLAFRDKAPAADKLAQEAWRSNNFVPPMLAGKLRAVVSRTGYITVGGKDEAAEYFVEYGEAWRKTPGAIEWLLTTTTDLKPHKRLH